MIIREARKLKTGQIVKSKDNNQYVVIEIEESYTNYYYCNSTHVYYTHVVGVTCFDGSTLLYPRHCDLELRDKDSFIDKEKANNIIEELQRFIDEYRDLEWENEKKSIELLKKYIA